MSAISYLKYALGLRVCPMCGSNNLIEQGYPSNRQWHCRFCNSTVPGWLGAGEQP
ncbi:MAG: hypothetical protein WC683_11910 [bacterium]